MHNNMYVNVIKILTIGGRYLWEEEDSLDIYQDVLEPNGIFIKSNTYNHSLLPNYYLCEVDTDKTVLTDFYKCEELPVTDEETFCWKTYTQLTDINKNIWLPVPDTVTLSNYKVSSIIGAILNQ